MAKLGVIVLQTEKAVQQLKWYVVLYSSDIVGVNSSFLSPLASPPFLSSGFEPLCLYLCNYYSYMP